MSELKAKHAFDVYEEYTKTGDDDAAQVYLKSEADNVISTIRAERDEYRYNLSCARNEIHNLSMSMREDVKRIADKDKVIADLKEKHKMEVEQLLMEIVGLKADYKEACGRLQTANIIKDEQKAKADKLLSCLKYLVMGDLIKDYPPKKVAKEIVKEYDNGLG